MVEDQPQATRSQVMGRERCLLATTGAKVSVTRTIGTRPTHGTVVCFNFVYSRRLWKFDTDVSFSGEERESRAQKRTSFLPFSCATCCPPNQEKRRGSRENLPKRGQERDTGGVLNGQPNQDDSRIFRLDNPGRRTARVDDCPSNGHHRCIGGFFCEPTTGA